MKYTTPVRSVLLVTIGVAMAADPGCRKESEVQSPDVARAQDLSHYGSVEITARLVEIPGLEKHNHAFPSNDLGYDYAYLMKYEIITIHRGEIEGDTVIIAHYNPLKPRDEAADERVELIGGDVKRFRISDVHRLALEPSIDDHYMGGMYNEYFGRPEGDLPVHWAVWTIEADG